jgi:hypothetical protein
MKGFAENSASIYYKEICDVHDNYCSAQEGKKEFKPCLTP